MPGGTAVEQLRRQSEVLSRDLLLAHTELLFERYMRQQHRQHIRRLYQDQVAAVSQDVDRQRLVRARLCSEGAQACLLTLRFTWVPAGQTEQLATQHEQLATTRQRLAAATGTVATMRAERERWERELRAQLVALQTEHDAALATHADTRARVEDLDAAVFRLTGQLEHADAKYVPILLRLLWALCI